MPDEIAWPPLSPRAALLSSPSGRKKYEMMRTSPSKPLTTTPNLLDRLRAARNGNINTTKTEDQAEDDEDEEILQLKLAAIEAKLRLKKLQQAKAKNTTPAKESSRPTSSHGRDNTTDDSQIEVGPSPIRRTINPSLPKSPSRVILGIDKGVRAADVSLKRANTITGTSRRTKDTSSLYHERPSFQPTAVDANSQTTTSRIKTSFSERMSQVRNNESTLKARREEIAQSRKQGFTVDKDELETYRLAAEERRGQNPQASPTRLRQTVEYTREDIIQAAEQTKSGLHLKKSRSTPNLRASPSRTGSSEGSASGDASLYEGFSQIHLSSRILPHSFLKRTLPSDQYTVYNVPDLLRDVQAPAFELPDTVCNFVVFGIIASKSGAMDQKQPASDKATVGNKDWERKWEDGSQNQRRFMALTLTDLKWTVDLYLFGTALPRYHRLTAGTVIAILNPGIMPPKPGRTDTGAFSLSLSSGDDTVLEIGTARDLGHCKTLKKDGQECGSWVDASKTEICEWHLNAQLAKTQSSRMGVNTGTNGFGSATGIRGNGAFGGRNYFDSVSRGGQSARGRTGLEKAEGQQYYDRESQSHFYISRSNSSRMSHSADISVESNPFGTTGQLDRDKAARIRKQLATKAKEREIAKKLGSVNSTHGFGGAGAEYLRQKSNATITDADSENPQPSKSRLGRDRAPPTSRIRPVPASSIVSPTDSSSSHISGSQRSALSSRSNFLTGSSANGNGKRTAQDVRLSPVKKTRFVTEKGIREAGRESLGTTDLPRRGDGGTTGAAAKGSDDDDDDELEIV